MNYNASSTPRGAVAIPRSVLPGDIIYEERPTASQIIQGNNTSGSGSSSGQNSRQVQFEV